MASRIALAGTSSGAQAWAAGFQWTAFTPLPERPRFGFQSCRRCLQDWASVVNSARLRIRCMDDLLHGGEPWIPFEGRPLAQPFTARSHTEMGRRSSIGGRQIQI